MTTDLAIREHEPLTAVEVRAQVNLIQEVMKAVMQKDQHYGVIPGAGTKPTLFKAGAEKLMTTFRLAADPAREDASTADAIRYRVICRLLTISGQFAGAGIGECSSDEEKYKWRSSVSKAEWEATPEDRRRIKYKRDGQVNQVRTNPADVANTILKMAKKRALVDAVLTVTAASDIFTQDIEDMPVEILGRHETPKTQPPLETITPEEVSQIFPDSEAQPVHTGEPVISEAQAKRFFAIAKKTGATNDRIQKWLLDTFGFAHSKDITRTAYDDVCDRVKELAA